MGILNRRNAVAGWAVWKLAKSLVRSKLRRQPPPPPTPPVVEKVRSPKAIAALLAAGAGLATFLRLRRRGDT